MFSPSICICCGAACAVFRTLARPRPMSQGRCLCQTPVLVPGPCAAAVLHCVVFLIHFPFSLGLIESEAICADRQREICCEWLREKSVAQACQRLATACCPSGSAEHLIIMTKVIDRAFYDFLMSVDAAVGKRDDAFINRAAAAFMHNEVVTLRLLPNPPAMTHLCVLVRRRARPGRRRPPVFQRRYAILSCIHTCLCGAACKVPMMEARPSSRSVCVL